MTVPLATALVDAGRHTNASQTHTYTNATLSLLDRKVAKILAAGGPGMYFFEDRGISNM